MTNLEKYKELAEKYYNRDERPYMTTIIVKGVK